MGRVGADFFGYHLKEVLEQNNVDTSRLRFDKEHHTGLAFVSWDEQGDASYLFYRNPSADSMFCAEHIDEQYLTRARVLQFGSLLLASEPSARATYHALHLASQAGLILSYDLNLRPSNWSDTALARQAVSQPLNYAYIVKLNRHELAFLTGDDDPATGTAKLWRENFRLVVMTLDHKGCFYRTAQAQGNIPSRVVEPVDTVGAGDGFMAGLLDDLRLADFAFEIEPAVQAACHQAATVGALTLTKPGAIPALPTRQEVDAFSL